MRIGAALAAAAIAALLSSPVLSEGETSGTDTATAQQQSLSQGELDALWRRSHSIPTLCSPRY